MSAQETNESPAPTKSDDSFPPQYDPKNFEDRIYAQWENAGAFHSEPRPGRKPYTVMIPPPNVTGVLHIGHALNNTLQDILVRWRRMQGFETLWMPGTDHAGIATQNVVEKQLAAAEKKNRYQIGRARLIEHIWKWKEQSGGIILNQLRKLGSSCDWERTRFTMDEGLSKAVRHAFVRLFNDGLIYRGKFLVNWCPRCRTTLSDDEVEPKDVKGKMYEIHYPFSDGTGRLTVATTRPETMLGDTAVAVHPDDARYTAFIGKMLDLPLTERKIPVIADSALELGFGTGCLKVTPAHDPVDYQIGLRHKLPLINIFTENALINENAPAAYRGLDRIKAREKIMEDLAAQGLAGEIKEHTQNVGHCYRCNTMIEPYLTSQWFVKMKPLSELAVKATAENRVKFHPERWTKVYLKWFEDVRDWPISRQVWWGHQIPVWYDLEANREHITTIEAAENEPFDLERDGKKFRYIIGEKATPIVGLEDPATLPEYKGRTLLRDPDVLDTWFSSGLWPFSTLGWPDKTPELDFYYPTSTLVTARGIIYFWVARMVMLGEKMLGKEPFSDVYIHGTVLDEKGKIMSKSLGNGIDPLDVIQLYGADALRFTLATMCTEGQDLKISMKRFEMGRNFTNKVWNATRYVLTGMDSAQVQAARAAGSFEALSKRANLRDEDRWILSRLNTTIRIVTDALEAFEFSKAIGALYSFFWNEFCSWYIELTKPRLQMAPTGTAENAVAQGREGQGSESGRRAELETAQAVLLHTLDRSLHLLHPFCPFVSEALWQELAKRGSGEYAGAAERHTGGRGPGGIEGMLIRSEWPAAENAAVNLELEAQFTSLFEAVEAVRAVRQELIDISPKDRKKEVSAALARPFTVTIRTADEALAARLRAQAHILMQMANTERPEIGQDVPLPKPASATAISGGAIYVALAQDLVQVEHLRLEKEIGKTEQYIPKVEGKLKNEDFIKNAPAELVAEERGRLAEARGKLDSLKAALAELDVRR